MEKFENIKSEKNIKSLIKYILKDRLFLFLPEKQKFRNRNKELQEKLDINIEDYKKIIGIYRIGERNGKGKEYYNDGKLIFEGQYLNGIIWNGKSKEYNYDGKLIFEGEYLNGERNGKGKEYNYNGKLIFEGEYLNGKRRNGKVKEYNFLSNQLIFEGEYLNEERIEKEYNRNGIINLEIKEENKKNKEYNYYSE